MAKIHKVTPPFAWELQQARIDQSVLTGQPTVQRPFWYEDDRGRMFYDLYACVGWPTEVSDKDEGMPGYIAIMGVVKSKDERFPAQDAPFLLMDETESRDVPSLLRAFLAMRAEYGYGCNPGFLQTLFGDAERFITTMALFNERLQQQGGVEATILVSPPDDFYDTKVFDTYMRSLRSCLVEGHVRLYFGGCEILKSRLREFRAKDPAVMAAGGLVHSLLNRCTWMDETREHAFTIEEDYRATAAN